MLQTFLKTKKRYFMICFMFLSKINRGSPTLYWSMSVNDNPTPKQFKGSTLIKNRTKKQNFLTSSTF